MNGCVDDEVIREIRMQPESREARKRMTEKNYRIASQFFSFDVLEHMPEIMLIYF
ncbi:MAG: hypothetical protein JW881_00520 [Spirochaetales bacterium]|nr:hypothetical protein [Spirochaetales bacterium]